MTRTSKLTRCQSLRKDLDMLGQAHLTIRGMRIGARRGAALRDPPAGTRIGVQQVRGGILLEDLWTMEEHEHEHEHVEHDGA